MINSTSKQTRVFYEVLRILIKIGLWVYFKSFKVIGKKNIPTDGPLIIVANHPGSIMDPLVIAPQIQQELSFITRGDVTRNRFWAWLFPRLNLIPVFRTHETPELMHKNKHMFKHCFDHLTKNGTIIIFPEGFSVTERRMRQLKTGTARIALGVEDEHNFELGVKILPIGLNYSDPHKFRSEVYLNIGQPIELKDYKEQYGQHDRKTVTQLTDDIRQRLKDLSVVVKEDQNELVEQVEVLYKRVIASEYSETETESRDFAMSKDIVDAVEVLDDRQPGRIQKLRDRITSYVTSLRMNKVEDKHIYPHFNFVSGLPDISVIFKTLGIVLRLLLGFPIWLYGLLNNYLPFILPTVIARMVTKREAHYGGIYLVLGIFTFIFFYTTQIALVGWMGASWWITLIYAVSLPITGFFAHGYMKAIRRIGRYWNLFVLYFTKRSVIISLVKQRIYILAELNKAKKEYLKIVNNSVEEIPSNKNI